MNTIKYEIHFMFYWLKFLSVKCHFVDIWVVVLSYIGIKNINI